MSFFVTTIIPQNFVISLQLLENYRLHYFTFIPYFTFGTLFNALWKLIDILFNISQFFFDLDVIYFLKLFKNTFILFNFINH